MRPSLLLDFAKTKMLDKRITFTRNSKAGYFDRNGVYQMAAAGEPRFDHDPVTGVCKGLLIEEQRTNLVTYSEQFDNAVWTKARSTIQSNSIIAPDGKLTADKLVENTATGSHNVSLLGASFTSGVTYTLSIFAKKSERNILSFRSSGLAFPASLLYFDLRNGAIYDAVAGGFSSYSCEYVSNGWCRLSATFAATSTTLDNLLFDLATDDLMYVYTGDGVSGLYAWGAQLEQGAFPTSYIPTEAASATRNADIALIANNNFSSFYRQDEGSLYVSAMKYSTSGIIPISRFDDNTANEVISIRGNGANPELYVVDNGVTVAQIDAGTLTANTKTNLFGSYKLNDCGISQNGLAAVIDDTATIPTVNQMRIGSDSTNYLNGHISRLAYFPKRLSNAELQALSAL